MSGVRYHFIVPSEKGPDSLEDPKALPAIAKKCFQGHKPTENAVALPSQTVILHDTAPPYVAPSTIFDSSRHLLHGVIHANGFGHLLRVNGREGGSRSTSGTQMVDLWDDICRVLCARQITVEDVSSKFGMELRILNKVALGRTWYGQWGYEFGRGPFNINEDRWHRAAEHVSAASLDALLYDFEGVENGVPAIIDRYRLPVGGVAVYVRQLGALLNRLLYLRNRPEDAVMFFDDTLLEEARDRIVWKGGSEKSKRASLAASMSTSQRTSKRSASKVSPAVPARTQSHQDDFHEQGSKKGREAIDHQDSVSSEDARSRTTKPRGSIKANAPKRLKGDPEGGSLSLGRSRNTRSTQLRVHISDGNASRKGNATSSSKEEENAVAPPQLEPLQYKANLSREDAIEKARQLARALRMLIPDTRSITTGATTRRALDAAFAHIAGKEIPPPNFQGPWWEFISVVLNWGYQCVYGKTKIRIGGDVMLATVVHKKGDCIEIDRQMLRQLHLFPEAWPVPFRAVSVRRANKQAAAKAGYSSYLPTQGDFTCATDEREDGAGDENVKDAGRVIGLRSRMVGKRKRSNAEDVQADFPLDKMGRDAGILPANGRLCTVSDASTDATKDLQASPSEPKAFKRTYRQAKAIDEALQPLLSPFPKPPLQTATLPSQYSQIKTEEVREESWRPLKFPLPMEEPWMHLSPGSDIKGDPTDIVAARNQVTRDLYHLFAAVLKAYAPEIARNVAQTTAWRVGERPVVRQLKLRQLSAEVQVLRDTKHFVKIYPGDESILCRQDGSGERPLVSAKNKTLRHQEDDALQLLCKLSLPQHLSHPPASTRQGRKFLPVEPPPELIMVSKTATVADFLHAATRAFGDIYRMMTGFTATSIVSGVVVDEKVAVCPKSVTRGDAKDEKHGNKMMKTTVALYGNGLLSAKIAPMLDRAKVGTGRKRSRRGEKGRSIGNACRLPIITVDGQGYDTKEVWLHAGGMEDWIVACPCGTRDDDGEAMVSCEGCKRWFHCRCVHYAEDAVDPYICDACKRKFQGGYSVL